MHVQPVLASQDSAEFAVPAVVAVGSVPFATHRKRRSSVPSFLQLEADASDGADEELDSDVEREEQRNLDAVMINNDDESGDSDVDEIASIAAVNRKLDERDNKRNMEQQAEREAKRRRRRNNFLNDDNEED